MGFFGILLGDLLGIFGNFFWNSLGVFKDFFGNSLGIWKNLICLSRFCFFFQDFVSMEKEGREEGQEFKLL